jgi:hypothetical protein
MFRFYERGGNWQPVHDMRWELTVAMPVRRRLRRRWFRDRGTRYWDIACDSEEVFRLRPSKTSWMST